MYWLLIFLLCLARLAAGEEIKATPNRPGIADPADVTQEGVLELE
jgi:hypothetical protein